MGMQRLEKLLLSGLLAASLFGQAQERTVVLEDVDVVQDRVAKANVYNAHTFADELTN